MEKTLRSPSMGIFFSSVFQVFNNTSKAMSRSNLASFQSLTPVIWSKPCLMAGTSKEDIPTFSGSEILFKDFILVSWYLGIHDFELYLEN